MYRNTVWVWNYGAVGTAKLIAKMKAIPVSDKGVIIKACDGRFLWQQWNSANVDTLRAANIKVGAWSFFYGTAAALYGEVPIRSTVAAQVNAVLATIAIARPDYYVLNIEREVLEGNNPNAEIFDYITAIKAAYDIPLYVSTVWHWEDWPFEAAVRAGIAGWLNQIYSRQWPSYRNYATLVARHGGGLPDYPAVNAYDTTAVDLADWIGWAGANAAGVSYWSAEHMDDQRWETAAKRALPDHVTDDEATAKAALETYWQEHQDTLGEKRFAARLFRDGWGGFSLFCRRGVIVYSDTDKVVYDETVRAIDDCATYNEINGTIHKY